MSAFASVTLKNGSDADKIFSPISIDSRTGVALWGTADAVYDQKWLLSMSSSVPTAKTSKGRAKLKLSIPYLVTENGVVVKKDEAIATVDIAIPKNMDSTFRAHLAKALDAAVSNAILTSYITNFEGIY